MVYADFEARLQTLTIPQFEDFEHRQDYTEAHIAYQQARQAFEQEFIQALAQEYLTAVPAERREEVGGLTYSLAYAQGHGSGYSDVENHYIDLADLVNQTYAVATRG